MVDISGADSVAWARERFLQVGDVPPNRLRAGIAESWRRSRLYAVDSARLDPPFIGDLDTDGPLIRAAQPVLDRLAETLSELAVSLIVIDARGRVLHRRVVDRTLMSRLDEIRLAPGFSYRPRQIRSGAGARYAPHGSGGRDLHLPGDVVDHLIGELRPPAPEPAVPGVVLQPPHDPGSGGRAPRR
jgi:hypothetical protein